MHPRPIVIGLLGGIASGKSVARRVLTVAGAAAVDADALAHAVLDLPEVRRALIERHGPAILRPEPAGGEPPALDRAAVAAIVFANRDHLAHLESLVHPRVSRRLRQQVEAHLAAAEVPAVVLDVPLLLEQVASVEFCDLLLFVDAPFELRARRVAEHRGWTAAELERREKCQLELGEKQRRADVVFDNSAGEADLERAILRWLHQSGGFAGLPRKATPRAPTPSKPTRQSEGPARP
ncbi:MAG: dephospho-CoA kinase [Planctomycetes bacterium]|nr:dephospho-CoA kinase [Planctomycetota bacterium]